MITVVLVITKPTFKADADFLSRLAELAEQAAEVLAVRYLMGLV